MKLDYQSSNDIEHANDIENWRKRTVEDRVYVFLVRLNCSLDQISNQVLTTPLSSLEEAYSQVRREVQRQISLWTLRENLRPLPLLSKSTRPIQPHS